MLDINLNPDSVDGDGESVETEGSLSSFIEDVSVLLEPTKHKASGQAVGTPGVVFNLLQTTMGVGILSLAAAFDYCGAAVGALIIVFLAVLTYVSVGLMLRSFKLLHSIGSPRQNRDLYNLEHIGGACFGRAGRVAVQSSLVGMCCVAMTAFLVPLKYFLKSVGDQCPALASRLTYPNEYLAVVVVVLIIPLTLLRKVSNLWITSLMGTFFVSAFVVSSVLYDIYYTKWSDTRYPTCQDLSETAEGDDFYFLKYEFKNLLSAVSIISSSFVCQISVFPMLKELSIHDGNEKSCGKILRATGWAMASVALMYTAAAGSGYDLWRGLSSRASSILACYDIGQPVIAVMYIGMSCNLIFAFPLVMFACRSVVLEVFYPGDPQPALSRHVALTFAILAPVLALAVVCNSLSTVVGVGGAFTSPQLTFIIPAGCYLKAVSLSCEQDLPLPRESFQDTVSAWCMLITGVCVQVGCITGSIMKLVE